MRNLLSAAFVGLMVNTAGAMAAPTQTLSYTILMGGDPIGHETVALTVDGAQTTAAVETDTKAKVLFLDFHYHHQRTETWVNGKLQHLVADTDDDGSIHHIETQAAGDVVKAQVDGVAKDYPGDALALTLWSKTALDHTNLYDTIDAKPFKVTYKALGNETVKVGGGRQVTAEHFHMDGDIEKDLWFGPDGYLVKVTFERLGNSIEVIRE